LKGGAHKIEGSVAKVNLCEALRFVVRHQNSEHQVRTRELGPHGLDPLVRARKFSVVTPRNLDLGLIRC